VSSFDATPTLDTTPSFDTTASFARTLVDEWVRSGIVAAVVSPGSRNTPLALALVRDARMRVEVVLDERSAGFRALGIGLATRRPAIVCCTSGTAAVNLHPAVVEAHHARVPLLACTADRPAELRDWGAGQTIDQAALFAGAVRWFHDPGPPDERVDAAEANARWRALACRAAACASGPPAGPVHLNLPFREPLVPTGAPLLDAPGRAHDEPWVRTSSVRREPTGADVTRLAALVRAHPRGLLVAGWGADLDPVVAGRFARAAGWPVFADPLSQLRTGPYAVSTYEALLRVDEFARAHRPDLVVRVGAPVTSKITNAWLDDVPTVVVDPDDAWLDPQRAAHERVRADPDAWFGALTGALTGAGPEPYPEPCPEQSPGPWLAEWLDAERRARRALDGVLDDDIACEGRIARDVAAAVPDGGALVVASSLPVRALEWCMVPRPGLRVLANRGANGIDGFVSTVLGVASSHAGPVVALCGDLCLLHDTNGLLASGGDAPGARPPATFVVVDNGGGGIFAYLPQHDLAEFETLFATPQSADLVAVARAHGVAAERTEPADLPKLVAEGADTARVLVVPVDRGAALEQHARGWHAVATALG
jgi:2-succinyl-5-enolpyruvyl-6-hydroxy-3-cyclohexene-1-carboxylate synthase